MPEPSYSSASAFDENKFVASNAASAIADFDFGVSEGDSTYANIERVSQRCADSVKHARLQADMTQAVLAKKCNEKTQSIVEIENATAIYNADLINRIEKALGAKIDRARKKPRKK